MQLKKNPKADLTKNSSLYFAIGLAVVLFISWQAIEWKTYEKTGYGYESLNVEDEDDEEVPITEQIKTPPPPPPPPPAPEVIEIVEDEEEVEETVIESTETDQEEIVEVEDIEVEDDFEDVDVPFAVIEDVPIFPGCEGVAKSQRRACFQEKMILEETEGNDHEETSVGQKSQESSLNVKSTKPPAMKRYASQVILILFL